METQTPIAPPPARARPSGSIVPHEPKWYQYVAGWLVYAALRTLAASLRYRWHDHSDGFLDRNKVPAIYCVWHNRLALCLPAYFAYARPRTGMPGMAAMASASKDGGFLAAILHWFRVQPVRGSSSRRGAQALRELTSWAKKGYDLAITPDGPRGPRYIVQEGVTSLAQLTGMPIMPFSYDLAWKIKVKSWDQFQIPVPFSRCEMRIGKPVLVPREATDQERERLRQELQETLRKLTVD